MPNQSSWRPSTAKGGSTVNKDSRIDLGLGRVGVTERPEGALKFGWSINTKTVKCQWHKYELSGDLSEVSLITQIRKTIKRK